MKNMDSMAKCNALCTIGFLFFMNNVWVISIHKCTNPPNIPISKDKKIMDKTTMLKIASSISCIIHPCTGEETISFTNPANNT